jgi:ATP-dependent DNA ligase
VTLELRPPVPPMEAETATELPSGAGWLYEPKWDGFRCLLFKRGDSVFLQSKSGQPLARYFPDVAAKASALAPRRFVLDGELVVPVGDELSFSELQLRLHPAASRVQKLAAAHPAELVVFDLLEDERGRPLLDLPLEERRRRLERFTERYLPAPTFRLSPASTDVRRARRWLEGAGSDLDGVVAKRAAEPYHSGERSGMVKVKRLRTADCVVGGFRYGEGTPQVASLLLGLYDDAGLLHHVGFSAGFTRAERANLTALLAPLRGGTSFTGSAPGGPSRWSKPERSAWEPVRPELVVEVRYDHLTAGRFRHGTRLLRFRPDKAPRQCDFAQLQKHDAAALS